MTNDTNAKRLLLVEDDQDQQSILSLVFEDDGYEVVSADDGETALELLQREQFSAIILDYMMPVMNGTEFLQALRSNEWGKKIPVLMLTSVATLDAEERFLQEGANAYCSKKASRAELLQEVESLLRS